MNVALDVLTFVAGALVVALVLDSAVRTFVLPRGVAVPYTRVVFVTIRWFFGLRLRWARSYESRDRIMALYAPLSLLALPVTWIVVVVAGYTAMFHALGVETWRRAFEASGSSLFTLGFVQARDLPSVILGFSEAAIGLGLLALLIAYLPTIYGAFSRREVPVAQLAVYAGTPPSAVVMLTRANAIGQLAELDDVWRTWQVWFSELGETHTSLAVLNFFRSPQPDRSWVTSAGCILDAAALAQSTLAIQWSAQASLCIRSGFLALREIAGFFGVPFDPDPAPDDPISIAREEFEAAYDALASAGVPVRPDRQQCWRDFAGWRVNYDMVLLALAGLTMPPYAPWSSDRSLRYRRPPLRRSRTRDEAQRPRSGA